MAETLSPIAPTESLATPVVPTVSAVPPAPVAPVMVDAAPEITPDKLYSDAARSGNPRKMLEFADTVKGTELHSAAMNAYNIMATNAKKFDDIIGPVEKKGGLQTPEGRLEFAKKWEPLQREPQFLRGVIEKMMGNPNARLFITNGLIKPKITYDMQGRPLREYYDELGERHGVIDDLSGNQVTPEEYYKRTGGAGVSAIGETLMAKSREERRSFNTAENLKANAAANAFGAASMEMMSGYGERTRLFQELYGTDLDKDTRDQLLSYANRGLGVTKNMQEGKILFDQYSTNKGRGLSEQQKKTLSSYISSIIPNARLGGEGTIVNDKNEKISEDKLKQLQETFSSSSNVEKSFAQNQKEAFESEVYKRLSPEQQQVFGRILDLTQRLEMKQAELLRQHVMPSFMMNPSAFRIGDQTARGEIQSLIGEFNAEVANKYALWRKQELKRFPEGQPPDANSLEDAFARTKEYTELKNRYQLFAEEAARRPLSQKKIEPNMSEAAIGGMVPPVQVAPVAAPRAEKPTEKASKTEFFDNLIKQSLKPKK
jgi:hypothetical protein